MYKIEATRLEVVLTINHTAVVAIFKPRFKFVQKGKLNFKYKPNLYRHL
jgi:hypothetical protein